MSTSISESTKQPIPAAQYKEQLLQAGDLVGHCRVIELLAAGGMANVYKVWHEQLEVIRAIKILKPGFSEEAKGRIETEAKISANLRHPNIVEIYGMGFWNDIPFIEMEYVDGPSLKDLLEKNTRLPVYFSLAVSHRVCTALQFAYNQDMTLYGKVYDRLIHRDIKPANILLTSKGVVKLADFGIARPSEVSIHTVGSKVMGTFAYLSPEQLNGEKLDQRSDVYSLGTVLYEMLTGSKTFPQKLLAELVQRKSRGQFIPVGSMGVSLPRQLCTAIEKSLALERNKRFTDASEFDVELIASFHKMTSKSPEEVIKTYLKNPYSPSAGNRPIIDKRQLIRYALITIVAALAIFSLVKVSPLIKKKATVVGNALLNDTAVPAQKTDVKTNTAQQQSQPPAAAPAPTLPTPATVVTDTIFKVIKKVEIISQETAPASQDPAAEVLQHYSDGDLTGALDLFKEIKFNALPSQKQATIAVRMLQACIQLGRYDDAQSIIINHPIQDGLFYLLKSRVALQKNDLKGAAEAAQTALTLSSKLDSGIKKKASFQLATIFHTQYEQKPNSSNIEQAHDAWTSYLANHCSDDDNSDECHEALENKSMLDQ